MIRIHERQLDSIGRAVAEEQFEEEMVVHLRRFSPRHAEVIGEAWVRRGVRLAAERARAYGIENHGLLRFYVELAVMFGSWFDLDPLHPWASAVLRDPGFAGEAARVDALYDAMSRYLEVVSDRAREIPKRALRNLAALLAEELDPAALRAERARVDLLGRIYPERCAYLGEARLFDLVRGAPEVAARHDLSTDRGEIVVLGLLFAIGPSFADEPFYPWVQATLRDPAIKTAERRAERLQRRTQIYLDRALAYLDRRGADVVL
jgi:hypothetical protein